MQPAEEIGRTNFSSGHFRQPCFHFRLRFHMGNMLNLQGALSGAFGKLLPYCRLNVARPRAVPFDQIRIIAVHRAHQVSNQRAGNWMQRSSKPFSATDDLQSQSRQIFASISQEWLHV